jgi:surface antigen
VRNRVRAAIALILATALGGCGMTLSLTSLQIDPETTATVARQASPLDPALDDEDWRRAQAALSLAVDPQGAGLPVNWDNPATKRRGSFVPTGNMVLVENTICRPFAATIVHAGTPPREVKHNGQACRLGPGEWAMKAATPASEATATIARQSAPMILQPLPAPTSSMLGHQQD